MKITKQELIDMNACIDGLARFVEQTDCTDEQVDVAGLVGGCNTVGDLMWIAGEKLPRERVVRLACDCALTCVELIEPYTDNYDEIVQFLKEPKGGDAADAAFVYADRAAFVVNGDAANGNDARAAALGAAYAVAAADARSTGGADYAAAAVTTVADCKRYEVHQLLIDMFNEVES